MNLEDMVAEGDPVDLVKALREFRPKGDRQDHINVKVQPYIWHSLEIVAHAARRSATYAALWALAEGSERLETLQAVRQIRAARMVVVRLGSDDSVALDEWGYKMTIRGSAKSHHLRNMLPDDIGRCRGLADELGIEVSTIYSLAILTALIGAQLPDPFSGWIETELGEFTEALRRRARLATEMAQKATKAPRVARVVRDIYND